MVVNTTFNETGALIENITLVENICTIHTITIENFTGLFLFMPFKLYNRRAPKGYKFCIPAKFAFAGICEKYTYTNQTTDAL